MRRAPYSNMNFVGAFGCGCVVDGSRYFCGPDADKGVHMAWCPPHTRNPIPPAKASPMTEKEEQELVDVMVKAARAAVTGYPHTQTLGFQMRAALIAAKAAGFTISRSRVGVIHEREEYVAAEDGSTAGAKHG